jgi:hypothetical protein
MKSTSEKFDILASMFKRRKGDDFSNVTIGNTSVSIQTKGGERIEVFGNRIQYKGSTVLFSEIEDWEWITPDKDSLMKDPRHLKATQFDNLYIYYPGGRLDLEGMGQAIFPIWQFIRWAR